MVSLLGWPGSSASWRLAPSLLTSTVGTKVHPRTQRLWAPKTTHPRGKMPSYLLNRCVRYVLGVLFRMAIRTQHLKVRQTVVFAVSVFVVDAKNRRDLVVSAPFASVEHPAADHNFSNCRIIGRRRPFRSMGHADTGATAIDPVLRRRASKLFVAAAALVFNGPVEMLRFVIALPRTVFCLVAPRGNMVETFTTNFTIGRHPNSIAKTQASARAVLADFGAVRPYLIIRAALLALHSDHGGTHAAI